jgi:hypothetical protein
LRIFMICTPHQVLFGWSHQGKRDGWFMWHVWGRREMHIVLVGKCEGKKTLGRHSHRWKHNIRMNLQ